MGPVRRSRMSPMRSLLFPFFDSVEVVFIAAIIVVEFIVVLVVSLPNGWIIPIGSYVGMAAVSWLTLPCEASLMPAELPVIRRALAALNMTETTKNRFVPPLPATLRWPRNAILLREGPCPSLSGPAILLYGVEKYLKTNSQERSGV